MAKTLTPGHKDEGLIDCNIDWNENKHKSRLSSPAVRDSQPALTYFRRLAEESDMGNLYLVKLITGRKHQIRCHFSEYLRTPIIGDTLYGSKDAAESGIFLHSYTTVFTDPIIRDFIFAGAEV